MNITPEIDALRSRLETSGGGLDAFRQGSIAVRMHAEEISLDVPLDEVVSIVMESPSDNVAFEEALALHPDELALGAAFHAYIIRTARRES